MSPLQMSITRGSIPDNTAAKDIPADTRLVEELGFSASAREISLATPKSSSTVPGSDARRRRYLRGNR